MSETECNERTRTDRDDGNGRNGPTALKRTDGL